MHRYTARCMILRINFLEETAFFKRNKEKIWRKERLRKLQEEEQQQKQKQLTNS